MRKKHILCTALLATAGVLSSCNDFLNVNPDNRTQIDTPEKVRQVLVSAYPENSFALMGEYMSDNVDEYQNTYSNIAIDEMYRWKDATQVTNDTPNRLWGTYYSSIANANEALKAIEKLGGPTTELLRLCKGEALLCRAYAHFMLVNIFCMNYGMPNSNSDMGIYYMYDTDTRIGQMNPRGTVAEVYQKIAKDLEEGLQLVGDSHLKVPKFHFNKQAAYAFAARFYLFHEEWDKAVKYATACLGSSPKTMLRDWQSYQTQPKTEESYTLKYINTDNKCNLLMQKAFTDAGRAFGNDGQLTGKKYTHGPYLDTNETLRANNIWGSGGYWDQSPFIYTVGGSISYDITYRIPALFQIINPVSGTGYSSSILPILTADETLLNRAEAYVMLKQYDLAAEDLTLWMQNIVKTSMVLTPARIETFYKAVDYSYSDAQKLQSTIKKHLKPKFAIDAEGSLQECMLQCVLGFKRIESLQTGMRWFDIKRYNIAIVRRVISDSGAPMKVTDILKEDDPRRAVQVPQDPRDAGVPMNPRN